MARSSIICCCFSASVTTQRYGTVARPCKRESGWFSSGMVNPFAFSWLWRGFKGKSVTFALLFACCVLGWTVTGSMFFLLRRLGVHWLFALVGTALLFSWLAKREPEVIPDEKKRALYARGIILLSVVIAVLAAWLKPRAT